MNLDWILSPLTLYILCSVCLLGSLLLWVSFKKELQSVRTSATQSYELLTASVQALSTNLAEIRDARRAEPVLAHQSPDPGFDLIRRAEAVRMSRQNESATAIAGTLRLPRNQVELLLKVEKLVHPGQPG